MTAKEMFQTIKFKYNDPGYIVLDQVRNGTGYQHTIRTADAIVMCTWPSRGYEIWGFEIKVNRSDWLKELQSPRKAEPIWSMCDRWYVACPKDVVKKEELPKGWGLMVMQQNGLTTKVQASINVEAQPLDRGFFAAMLRVAIGKQSTVAQMQAEYERGRRDGFQQGQESHERQDRQMLVDCQEKYRALRQQVNAFELEAGVSVANSWGESAAERGALVKQILRGKFNMRLKDVSSIAERACTLIGAFKDDLQQIQERWNAVEEGKDESSHAR